MITVKGIIKELSDAMPDYIVERKGRTNFVDVYTGDRRWGIRIQASPESLSLSDCPRIAKMLTSAFNRALQEENNATS